MTVQELIQKYNITLQTKLTDKGWELSGMLAIREVAACKRDGKLDEIKAKKSDILAVLMEERKAEKSARTEREAKINAIPGLREIKAAQEDMKRWREEFNASFESEAGGSVGVRTKPKYDMAGLYAKYPRAKAYLEASDYSNADHYVKAAAGKKALEAIINGEDYEQAINTMKAEWAEYTADHMWG